MSERQPDNPATTEAAELNEALPAIWERLGFDTAPCANCGVIMPTGGSGGPEQTSRIQRCLEEDSAAVTGAVQTTKAYFQEAFAVPDTPLLLAACYETHVSHSQCMACDRYICQLCEQELHAEGRCVICTATLEGEAVAASSQTIDLFSELSPDEKRTALSLDRNSLEKELQRRIENPAGGDSSSLVTRLAEADLQAAITLQELRRKADAAADDGDFEYVVHCYQQIVEHAPFDALSWMKLGLEYSHLGEGIEAVACLERAAEEDSENEEIVATLAALQREFADELVEPDPVELTDDEAAPVPVALPEFQPIELAAGHCDICTAPVEENTGQQLAAIEIRQLAGHGFNPFEHDLGAVSKAGAILGLSQEDQHRSWYQRIISDDGDSRLCEKCVLLKDQFIRDHGADGGEDGIYVRRPCPNCDVLLRIPTSSVDATGQCSQCSTHLQISGDVLT